MLSALVSQLPSGHHILSRASRGCDSVVFGLRQGQLLTGNNLARVGGSDSAPLQLQSDGAAGGGIPVQRSGRSDLEVVALGWDLEGVGVLSRDDSSQSAGSDVEDGAHLEECGLVN